MDDAVEVRTNCRSCWAGCGVLVQVEAGERIVGVRGDPGHPRSKGYMCPKGVQLLWGHNRPDRLNHPSLEGRAAGWDATLDDLARRIEAAIARGGPDAFGVMLGSGSDTLGGQLLKRLKTALGSEQFYSPLTVDIAPTLKAAELVTGYAGQLLPRWEMEDEAVTLLVFFGSNPVVSHGYVGAGGMADASRILRGFQARGGKLWVFDPVKTRTARLADEHAAPIPGTDPVILAWLVRQALDGLAADAPALRTTRGEDRARLRAALAPFDLSTASRIAGVDAAQLERLWADIRAAGRLVIPGGTGLSFGPAGVVGEWLRWALLILTDSLEAPGGMWFDAGWSTPLDAITTWSPAPEEGRTASAPASRPDLQRMFGETPCAALVDEIESGPLRTLLVLGASPLTAIPDPERTRRALASLDALAVMDVAPTPLTAMATHVLPATGQLERADISGLTHSYPQLALPVVAPVAERRHAWAIIGGVAKRLGVGDKVLVGADLATATDEGLLRPTLAGARNSFEELQAAGSHGLAGPRQVRWAAERALPGGQWRLAPEVLVRRLPSLLSARTGPEFPLLLTCGRQDRRLNSFDNIARPRDGDTPGLRMAPDDAARLGVVDGGRAFVRSAHGAVTVRAMVDPRLREGVVALPHGWSEANATHLTDSRVVDPLTAQPQMSAIPVAVEPAA
jgi:anaerobic selenocysteine-containing dehydrogenase